VSSPYRYSDVGSPVWHTTSSIGTGVGEGEAVGVRVGGPGVADGPGVTVRVAPGAVVGDGLGPHAAKNVMERMRDRKRKTGCLVWRRWVDIGEGKRPPV
jgi:hypothetical protein